MTHISHIQKLVDRVKHSTIGQSNGDIQNAISEGISILTKKIEQTDGTRGQAIISANAPITNLVSMISPLTEGSTSERTKRAEAAEALMLLVRRRSSRPSETPLSATAADGAAARTTAGPRAGIWRSMLEDRLALARDVERDRTIRAIVERALEP